ncbi:MAG TPA: hypothetical protein VE822_14740 [Candidatus Elarobacter sp.]|nr:hypothetical protein [Candidatus Elarobacter sp.]
MSQHPLYWVQIDDELKIAWALVTRIWLITLGIVDTIIPRNVVNALQHSLKL